MTQQSQVISILLLAAEPTDLGRMHLDREFRAVHESLLRARYRDHFEVQQLPAARPPDLRRALLDHRPQVLHFCGHGTGGTGLALEDEHGAARLVSTEVLAELFGLFARDLRCVVLNACYSEQQAQVILRHIDYVIGMQKEIADTAAIGFSRGFYDALFAGEPVHRAFELGKNAIRLEGPPDAVPSLNARHLLPPSTSTGVIVPDHLKPVILAHEGARPFPPALNEPSTTLAEIEARFEAASRRLIQWETTLDGGRWIDRPELVQLEAWLSSAR